MGWLGIVRPMPRLLTLDRGRLGESMDIAQIGLLLGAWVVAFMLGTELQSGFLQWREGRRGQ